MNEEDSKVTIPPGVCGNVIGTLKISIDQVYWIDKPLENDYYIQLTWWGGRIHHYFYPETHDSLSESKNDIIFLIRTSKGLFETYLLNCEQIDFHLKSSKSHKIIGTAQVKYDKILKSSVAYYPIKKDRKRIADLCIGFELFYFSDKLFVDIEEEYGVETTGEKRTKSFQNTNKVLEQNNAIISSMISKGQELRKAMVSSVMASCDFESKEQFEEYKNNMPCLNVHESKSEEKKLVDYLMGKKMTKEEEEEALNVLRCKSPLPSLHENIINEPKSPEMITRNFTSDINDVQEEIPKLSDIDYMSSSKEALIKSYVKTKRPLNYLVDSYRIGVQCLILTPSGSKKIFHIPDYLPPNLCGKLPSGTTFILEYHSISTIKKLWTRPSFSISAKYYNEDAVKFNEFVIRKIKPSPNPWDHVNTLCSGSLIKIYCKHSNQRQSFMLAETEYPSSKNTGFSRKFCLPLYTRYKLHIGNLLLKVDLGIGTIFGEEISKLLEPKEDLTKLNPRKMVSRSKNFSNEEELIFESMSEDEKYADKRPFVLSKNAVGYYDAQPKEPVIKSRNEQIKDIFESELEILSNKENKGQKSNQDNISSITGTSLELLESESNLKTNHCDCCCCIRKQFHQNKIKKEKDCRKCQTKQLSMQWKDEVSKPEKELIPDKKTKPKEKFDDIDEIAVKIISKKNIKKGCQISQSDSVLQTGSLSNWKDQFKEPVIYKDPITEELKSSRIENKKQQSFTNDDYWGPNSLEIRHNFSDEQMDSTDFIPASHTPSFIEPSMSKDLPEHVKIVDFMSDEDFDENPFESSNISKEKWKNQEISESDKISTCSSRSGDIFKNVRKKKYGSNHVKKPTEEIFDHEETNFDKSIPYHLKKTNFEKIKRKEPDYIEIIEEIESPLLFKEYEDQNRKITKSKITKKDSQNPFESSNISKEKWKNQGKSSESDKISTSSSRSGDIFKNVREMKYLDDHVKNPTEEIFDLEKTNFEKFRQKEPDYIEIMEEIESPLLFKEYEDQNGKVAKSKITKKDSQNPFKSSNISKEKWKNQGKSSESDKISTSSSRSGDIFKNVREKKYLYNHVQNPTEEIFDLEKTNFEKFEPDYVEIEGVKSPFLFKKYEDDEITKSKITKKDSQKDINLPSTSKIVDRPNINSVSVNHISDNCSPKYGSMPIVISDDEYTQDEIGRFNKLLNVDDKIPKVIKKNKCQKHGKKSETHDTKIKNNNKFITPSSRPSTGRKKTKRLLNKSDEIICISDTSTSSVENPSGLRRSKRLSLQKNRILDTSTPSVEKQQDILATEEEHNLPIDKTDTRVSTDTQTMEINWSRNSCVDISRTFTARIDIERAVNLISDSPSEKFEKDNQMSSYVTILAETNEKVSCLKSHTVFNDRNPVFNVVWNLRLASEKLFQSDDELEIIVVVDLNGDQKALKASIDLTTISAGLSCIDGWYALSNGSDFQGQLKVKITPLEDVSVYRGLWSQAIIVNIDRERKVSDVRFNPILENQLAQATRLKLDKINQLMDQLENKIANSCSENCSVEFEEEISKLNMELKNEIWPQHPSETENNLILDSKSLNNSPLNDLINSTDADNTNRILNIDDANDDIDDYFNVTHVETLFEAIPKDNLQVASDAIEKLIQELKNQRINN